MPCALALTALILLASPAVKDLDDGCQLAKQLVAQKPASFSADPRVEWTEAREAKWRTQMAAQAKDPAFQKLLETSPNVDAAERLSVFIEFAKQIGQPKWNCPALEKVLIPPDRDFEELCRDTRQGSMPPDFHWYSPIARAAWDTAKLKQGKAGYEALWAASEYPEKTFEDSDGLKRVLGAMVPKTGPSVSLEGQVETEGASLGLVALYQAMQKNVAGLSDCGEKQHAQAGTTAVELKVAGGRVSKSTVKSGAGPAGFNACIQKQMKAWAFVKASGTSTLTFTLRVD